MQLQTSISSVTSGPMVRPAVDFSVVILVYAPVRIVIGVSVLRMLRFKLLAVLRTLASL